MRVVRLPKNLPLRLFGEALMDSYETLMGGLAQNQRDAATIGTNAVIAAGAGSGKTRVLAARFVHLVVREGIPVDAILALTFTRKAAAEMYARIHATLSTIDDPRARRAVADFHRARISTIDSFCGAIARNASRAYGVAPDFGTDSSTIARIAEELALPFFLEKRKSRAIRQLTRRFRMADLPAKLFAETMIKYSSLPEPLDFARFYEDQRRMTRERIASLSGEIISLTSAMRELPEADGKTVAAVRAALPEDASAPDPESAAEVAAFVRLFEPLVKCAKLRSTKDPAAVELGELFADFKDRLYPALLAAANWTLNGETIRETLDLLSEFQDEFNRKKREAGILTFADVARMAVDALKNDPALRRVWKDSIQSIMIDEFQDDNQLQRDLLFLIAERPERTAASIPGPDDLVNGKLFFVGDEKQSIYRFRGADVSVFRELARDLSDPLSAAMPSLDVNYRTEAPLIEAFNRLFPRVFPAQITDETGKRPLYEAEFSPIEAANRTEGAKSAFEIFIVPKENFDRDAPGYLTPEETEAREIADRIARLVNERVPIAEKGKARPCKYGDIAILLRSGTNQRAIERQLREAGIPYQTENVRGLFDDAPVNDLYALLRLAAYPADTTAYAALLRSPFVGISDEGFARAILARTAAEAEKNAVPEPFADDILPRLSETDRDRFARARDLYQSVRNDADRRPSAEMVSRLWYGEGYRYALFTDYGLERYAELYDYFFELARLADEEDLSLAGFLDRVAGLMATGEKIDALDIPVEQSGGVTIMTVHKSKGLEFPVVFVADAGSEGAANRNASPVYYSPECGISVNTGASDENEAARDNWFYERDRDGELRREIAEARRLLYVAMTRAGTRLVVSGTLTLAKDGVTSPREGDELMEAIALWAEKREESADAPKRQSFLRMLLAALAKERRAGDPVPLVTVAEVLPKRRGTSTAERAFRDRTADPATAARYAEIPEISYRPSAKSRYAATELQELTDALRGTEKATSRMVEREGRAGEPVTPNLQDDDRLDALLERTKTPAADFGTWTHRAIEARFLGTSAWVPDDFRPLVEEMANRFASSELGTLASQAAWRESEYGFITRYTLGDRPITVTGQMDLIFETGGTVYVVDYKTDRVEDPEIHAEQLAVYRKAARELREKPAETWLFYLRSGNAVRLG
jgi:ATP-dependent helicase/nuclease subunit A